MAAMNEPEIKTRVRHATDAAVEKGVFGSPFIFVDGEPFWGSDRLDQVSRKLATIGAASCHARGVADEPAAQFR